MAYVKEICYLVSILIVSLNAQTNVGGNGILEIVSVTGRINTRSGCNESIICQGVGVGLVWKKVPSRANLNSTNTRTITIEERSNGLLLSRLSFSPITERDDGTYTCIISDEDDRQRTQSLGLTVDADPLEITPVINNIDISTSTVNDVLPITCSVSTCASGIRVFLLKDDEVKEEGSLSHPDVSAYNFDLIVDDDTPGTYACRVESETPMLSTMQIFNITGTPILPPGSTRPPTLPPGVTKSPTDPILGGDETTTDDDDSSLSLRINVILLSILLLLSFTQLLA